VAVASAGPSASLHLALSVLQAGCPSCHPTNSVKALKAALPCKILNSEYTVYAMNNFIISSSNGHQLHFSKCTKLE